jgi:hypothetical protein
MSHLAHHSAVVKVLVLRCHGNFSQPRFAAARVIIPNPSRDVKPVTVEGKQNPMREASEGRQHDPVSVIGHRAWSVDTLALLLFSLEIGFPDLHQAKPDLLTSQPAIVIILREASDVKGFDRSIWP